MDDHVALKDALAGMRVAIPESRELDLFARMLEERGASALRCPLIAIRDTPDQALVVAWLERFIASPPPWLVLLTGEGLNRLLSAAERQGCKEAFKEALSRVSTLTRGPKPGRALRSINLRPNLVAASPTTAGVIQTMETLDLQGKRVGVQLYGEEPNPELMQALHAAGATVDSVAPYIYTSDLQDPEVSALIRELVAGTVDVIAFTSKTQVSRLFTIAEHNGSREALSSALERVWVASVGPVVAETLSAYGVTVDMQPVDSYFMKPLVRELVDAARNGLKPANGQD